MIPWTHRALPLLAAFILATTGAAQQPKTLDHLTAYFVYLKLSGEPANLEAIADRTQRVMRAKGFGKIAIRALELTQLKAKYEAADPEALYVISFQTLMTYELNQARFSVQTFEPGRVLVLSPFGQGSAHPMPANLAGQFSARLLFANADEARYVPLAPDQARVIDPVARSGSTGAVAEVRLRFTGADSAQRVVQAQAESVSYRYAAAPGLVRMANPRRWPLNEPVAVAPAAATEGIATMESAGAPAASAATTSDTTQPSAPSSSSGTAATETARPMDALTLFLAYHKLSGEPVDFDEIVRKMQVVQRASPFDREEVAAEKAAELRELYEAADTTATYVVSLRTPMRYEMNQGRFDVDTFGPDRFISFPSPFMPTVSRAGAAVRGNHGFMDQTLAYRYGRRLSFANAENARHLPVPQAEARLVGANANVVVEVHFKLADTVDSTEEQFKTVRAQITSVRYAPSIGMPANWPLKDPVIVAAADLSDSSGVSDGAVSAADAGNRLDNWTVYFLYAKVAGEPVDFEGIAERSENYRRASQFDKADVLAREAARMREQYDAIDPKGTFSLRVGGALHYEMEQERFRAELFDPGKFINFNPMRSGTAEFALSARRVAFANADAVRFIPVSRDKAAQVGQVRRLGNIGASAELELAVAGTGDPTGAVDSSGTLRMAVRSVRFHPSQGVRPEDVWPFEDAINPPAWTARMDPQEIAPDKFDTMGLKTGVRLDALKRTIEKEFGPVVNINPTRSEDPRLKSGVGFSPDSCFAFGNKVPSPGEICIRAYADDRGIVRKIIVEQILEGAEWEPTRVALLGKYGAMAEAARKSQTQYYGWGPQVVQSIAADDSLSPNRALTASLSPIQSALDRMSASTRVSTNLKIRLIDAKWAGAPPASPAPAQQQEERPAPPRTPRL